MSWTSWTLTWSVRAWMPQPAWQQWRGCRWQRWSAGMSRRGPSGCWRTWRRTGPSASCWPRCWKSTGSSWGRPTPPWAGRWQPSCCRSRPLPTTWRSCCGWRAAGPPVRRGLPLPQPPSSASLRESCGAWGCCGSWPSGLSGLRGTCGSSPSPAQAAARPPAGLRAPEGGCGAEGDGVPLGHGKGPTGRPCGGLITAKGAVQRGGQTEKIMSLAPKARHAFGATPCRAPFPVGKLRHRLCSSPERGESPVRASPRGGSGFACWGVGIIPQEAVLPLTPESMALCRLQQRWPFL